jgi:hypothetical protein
MSLRPAQLLPALLLACGLHAALEAAAPPEYQVKAALLFNFAKFVEWPDDAFAGEDAPFVIGVLGFDPFGPDLDKLVRQKSIHGHNVVVRRFPKFGDLASCQVLFVSAAEVRQLPRALERLKGESVLTVTESDGPPVRGAVITLFVDEGRIRFAVDLAPAQSCRLKISSQLLRMGRVVGAALGGRN